MGGHNYLGWIKREYTADGLTYDEALDCFHAGNLQYLCDAYDRAKVEK